MHLEEFPDGRIPKAQPELHVHWHATAVLHEVRIRSDLHIYEGLQLTRLGPIRGDACLGTFGPLLRTRSSHSSAPPSLQPCRAVIRRLVDMRRTGDLAEAHRYDKY